MTEISNKLQQLLDTLPEQDAQKIMTMLDASPTLTLEMNIAAQESPRSLG